jgi:hypothetical protein
MLEDVASHAGVKADHFVEALERKEAEFRPHRMLDRIHTRFKELAEKGSPAVLLLRSMLKYHDASAGTFSWDRVGGHFVVFKDVQRELRDDEQGFSIQILDPQSGKVQTIYVYEETMLGFAAEGEPEAGCTSGAELKRFVSSEMGYDVLSPYLKVLMPRIDLTPQSYRQNEVNVVTLSGMAGLF